MTTLKQADFEVPSFGEFNSPPASVPRYALAVNALAPTAYWRLGEASGVTLADQTGTHPLTLTGSYTLAQSGALSTDDDHAIFFDGGTAQSALPVLPGTVSAPFSIAFWLRKPSEASVAGLFMGQFTTTDTGHMRLVVGGDRMLLIVNGEPQVVTSKFVTTDWQMFVLTRSATGIVTWYIDGQPDALATGHTTAIHATALKLGNVNNWVAKVELDEVAIFDYDLSASQARWLYTLGVGQLTLPPSP